MLKFRECTFIDFLTFTMELYHHVMCNFYRFVSQLMPPGTCNSKYSYLRLLYRPRINRQHKLPSMLLFQLLIAILLRESCLTVQTSYLLTHRTGLVTLQHTEDISPMRDI